MRISSRVPYAWDQINSVASQLVDFDGSVKVYRGLPHALFEVCMGLHLRFTHKRKIVAQLGWGDHMHTTMLELAKLGVRVKDSFDEDMKKEEKAVLAYVFDRDDALTAELYDRPILQSMGESRIFKVHIYHHQYFYDHSFLKNIGEYDIAICSLTNDYALVFAGAKANLPNLSANEIGWGSLQRERLTTFMNRKGVQKKDEILAFEKSLPEACTQWFDHDRRLFDRAVVTFTGVDGSAFVDIFCQQNGFPILDPGEFVSLESASYCRWNNKHWFDQCEQRGRTLDQLRGFVSFSAGLVDADLPKKVQKTLEEIESLST